ncbi:uncharacterized protein RCO7_03947 [Rhynchosporium graminicola]|uniref:BZIP domain-containing protein n=1 Tax=Rhynchosporium graminicola TaxID=2792576 RepID=A0A1E1L5N7_9HELO|nr:uncharacterized protein RCO7_03947 [Rhynchosporium commune]
MSSTGSNSPISMDVEEPRKKGSRGGKRSVTHLSKAQLARKRANDREAQRNIRQRTKEHIENLERKVKELEQGSRSGSIERVLKRNRDLEEEVEKLRAQITGHHTPITGHHTPVLSVQIPPEIPDDMMLPHKVELDWARTPTWPPTASHLPILNTSQHIATSNAGYPSTTSYPASASSMGYEGEGSIYTPTESWGSPVPYGSGPQSSQGLAKSVPAWSHSPVDPSFSHQAHMQQMSSFNIDVNNQHHPYTTSTTCWQNTPQNYTAATHPHAWQMSTKLKTPVTYLDQLMHSVIHAQRHLFASSPTSREELLTPSYPSVHILFGQPGPPEKSPSEMTIFMEKYANVLSTRGFPMIPEKLSSFMCMYRFVQWQISPTYETYNNLYEWQTPRPCQLMIPHPAWMDLPPWGKFRDRVIENQDKYDTEEFQLDYASNFRVNFPGDPMKALIFDNGKMLISPLLERHLSDITHLSMKKAFGDKYPEFRDVCRIDDV